MNAVISSISTHQLPAIANPVMSTAQLHNIVSRASTLFERLDSQIFSPSPETDEKLLQSRLDTWCQTVGKGNFEHFQKYLEWDGLNLETAKSAIAPVSLRHDAPLPNWAKTLSSVLNLAFAQAATNPDATTSQRFLIPQSPLPFEDILAPFVLFAQQELIARTGQGYQRLTDEVHGVFERSLLGQLIDMATQPLQIAFTSWRAGQQSSFTRLLAQTQELQTRNLYVRFVRDMLQGKLTSFFVEYAALARLLATATELWVESQLEFLHHLDADWSEIAEKFNNGEPLGQVTSVQPLRSDPHRGRRSVITLKIEPNLHLVYKPKHLGTEQAYNQLLAWLNEQGSPLPLKTLQVINRDSHGWVEFVASQACEDTAQLERHYQRAGMLLCLIYVLDATDCHYENLIASGEHPVLIDTETLMQHRPEIESSGNVQTAQKLAFDWVDNSVMRTALLPVWHPGSNGNSGFDFSGLGSHNQEARHYKGLQWSSVNTDQMALNQKLLTIDPFLAHVPTLNGQPASLSDWIEAVATGFEQMYHFLQDKKEVLLSQDSPLWTMARQLVRFVFRPTNTYFRILNKLRSSEYLRDGVDRSIGLEILKLTAAGATEKPKLWSILQAERQQMEQLDIPFFSIYPNTDVLELSPDSQLEGFFQGSSFELVLERIKNLSKSDLAMQVSFIRNTLYLRMIPGQEIAAPEKLANQTLSVQQSSEVMLDESDFVSEVMAIARRLQERAICAPDGSVTWLAPQFIGQQQRFQFQPAGLSLFDGKLGIALFLAAVEHIKKDGEFRELCLGALQEFRQGLSKVEQPKAEFSNLNLGLSAGLGGWIYSLTKIGQFLNDDRLLADAVNLAHSIVPEAITSDRDLDIAGGTAGTLLSLLALYQVVRDPIVLESACLIGRHLLAQSVITSNGRAWKTLDGRLLTGFSHGAGGIAYALLKLAQVTNDTQFQMAAAEAIAYEQSVFLPEVGNWPDLRDFSKFLQATNKSEPPSLMSSWCHGAAGIGLARLGGLAMLSTEAIHQDIQVAIKTTQKQLTQKQGIVNQLCCGHMGQIEFLLCAASRLGKSDLLINAKVHASQVVQQARQKGYYLEPALHSSVYVPGLFRGEVGIGYTLLRLTHLEQLPSILLWE
ncbi:type 2 lanthipeptide synthetase LanM family protein [Nostoc sp.]|uniref:type 2 lanthipeptide synthetase LanM family protein n=1 Tax=Nostoc sp. TaxID=1180 RepID=UPI002FF9EE7E